jgi:large subunit ribosomal protein L22
MSARAMKRYERLSPRKAKMFLDVIKGKSIHEARALLQFHPSRSKMPILKTLNSAVANFKNKVGTIRIDDSELFVKDVRADAGPTLKRWRSGFRGTADMIRRRTCHIVVTVDSYKPIEKKGG